MFNDTEDSFIAFSRTTVRPGYSYAPLIGSFMNSQNPCFGPDQDRLIVDDNDLDLQLSFDIEKEQPINSCPTYEWRLKNKTENLFQSIDDRFTGLGYTSLFEL